jgi:hypothetical protein
MAVPAAAITSCLLAVALFGVGARDDDYITFWEAEQLAKTGSIVNLNGTHIEQSSSLAHVLLLALLFFITRSPLPVLAYLVGLISLCVTIWLASRLARSIDTRAEVPSAFVVALGFPLIFWATGGLETTMAAAAVLWFVIALRTFVCAPVRNARDLTLYTASSVLVVTVRPDTMLVSVAVACIVLVGAALSTFRRLRLVAFRSEIDVARAAVATGVVALAAALLACVRLVAFGSFVPQPEIAKSGGFSWLHTGFSYVYSSFPWWLWVPLLTFFVIGVVRALTTSSVSGLIAAATFFIGTCSIMFSRGDWMGGARLLAPYLAPGLVVATVGICWMAPVWRRLVVLVLIALEGLALVLFANGASWLSSANANSYAPTINTVFEADLGSPFGATVTSSTGAVPPLPWYTAWDYPHARDAVFLAQATPVLRRIIDGIGTRTRVTIASYQAGMVMYTWANDFPGRLEFLDMDNIVTSTLSTCPGLTRSYSGDLIDLRQWARDAGRCTPRMPDLVVLVGPPSQRRMVNSLYHVVAETRVTYRQRHLLGSDRVLRGTEFLAMRDGWHP